MQTDTQTPTDPAAPAPLLLGFRPAAAMLGISPRTLENLRAKEGLPSVKIGTRRLFDPRDLRAWIDSRKEGGKP